MNRFILVPYVLGALVSSAASEGKPESPGNPGTTAAGRRSGGEAAKISPAKEAEIRRLLEVSGIKNVVNQMMGEVATSMRPLIVNSLPPGVYRERLVNLFFEWFQSKIDPRTIIDMAVPLYEKYLTEEEIKGLAEFYSTPLGHKTVEVLPKLMGDMNQLGRVWGEKLGRDSMTEVLTEHPDLKAELEEAAKRARGK